MKQKMKRYLALLLTICMVFTILPTQALAAMIDNSVEQNRNILQELKDFWGDDKTAEDAWALLNQYGLIDENGVVKSDWSQDITIGTNTVALSFSDAVKVKNEVVTVNGRACPTAELQSILAIMKDFGVLTDDGLRSDWQLSLDGASIAPGALLVALRNQTQQLPRAEKIGVTTVLGTEVAAERLLPLLTFLDNYALLSDFGAKDDWGLTLPSENRPTNLGELVLMLEDETVDRNQTITVGGKPITLGDFETMMGIEKEIKRIQENYFEDHTKELTPAHSQALDSLWAQLERDGGIQLFDNRGMESIAFPSGTDHTQSILVPQTMSIGANSTSNLTVTLAHPAKSTVSVDWKIDAGSAGLHVAGNMAGTLTFHAGEQSKGISISNNNGGENWNGNRTAVVQFSNPVGALLGGEFLNASSTIFIDSAQAFPPSETPYFQSGTYVSNGGTYTLGGGMNGLQQESPLDATVQYFVPIPDSYKDAIRRGIYTQIYANFVRFGNWSGNVEVNASCKTNSSTGQIVARDSYNRPYEARKYDGCARFAIDDSNRDAILNAVSLHIELQVKHSVSGIFNFDGVKFQDATAPTVKSVSAPVGAYSYGQKIPITVTFSEVVNGKNLALTANGQNVSAAVQSDGAFSTKQTFLYPVKRIDTPNLQIEKIWGGRDLSGKGITQDTTVRPLSGVSIQTPSILSALKMPTESSASDPVYNEDTNQTTVTAKVKFGLAPSTMPEEKPCRDLVIGSYLDENGVVCNDKFAASLDGGATLIPLTYDNNTTPEQMIATCSIDLENIKSQMVMEIYRITVNGNKPVKGALMFGRYGAFSVKSPQPMQGSQLSFTLPGNWPSEAVYLNNPPQLQLAANVSNIDLCTWKQYAWKSTEESVATIDATGRISFLKKGAVQFYLAATNGGLAQYQGANFESARTPVIQTAEGSEPYIKISETQLTIRAGEPVVVRWASNIAQKNAEYAPSGSKTTDFVVTIKDKAGEIIQTKTMIFDPDNKGKTEEEKALWPNQSVSFDGLTNVSADGKASYTATVFAKTNESVPGHNAQGFQSEEMAISVVSKPVYVTLRRPANLLMTNEKTNLEVFYGVQNFDATNKAAFRISVTDNATGTRVVHETTPPVGEAGSFIIPLSVENGFRNIYDVTIEAKNPADNSWSRDSFTLYVYDKNCLDIVAASVENNRVVVTGNQVTLNNQAWIASLTQDEILALKRDINLKTLLTINYGQHDWSEAIDRIQWQSKDSSIASVNYRMDNRYANIEELQYPSYAPITDFLLSGKNDGTTVIEAIHALAGDALKSDMNVTVETLKNKLYLFQCYPATQTKLTYIDGNGIKKTRATNAKGQAAIYEESGISADIYLESDFNSEKYLGTIYNSQLVSQEKDSVTLELYPLNTINLRKAASAPIYLKKADGTDYTGSVAVRTGVYRNGVYCEGAMVNNQNLGTGSNAVDYIVSFKDGKYVFNFDLMQFDVQKQGPVSAADDIKFVFELRATGCYPVLFEMSGAISADYAIRLGEQVVNLEKASLANEKKPFIAQQFLYFSSTDSGAEIDIRGLKSRVGPSKDSPEILLKTTVFWWGEDTPKEVFLTDKNGVVLKNQVAENSLYPFCSITVTSCKTPINKAQFEHLRVKSLASCNLIVNYQIQGGKIAKKDDMAISIVNALEIKSVLTPEDWKKTFAELKTKSSSSTGNGLSLGNEFIGVGLALASALSVDIGMLKLQLTPTADPLVYNGLVYAGLGNIEKDNVSGAQADVSLKKDLDAGPGLADIKSALKNGVKGYGTLVKDQLISAGNILNNNIKQGSGTSVDSDGDTMHTMSGCFETQVYYDSSTQAWEMTLINGGFTAGGGYGRHWTWNTQVGPVPMFLDLGFGANAVVDFKAAVNSVHNYNDYLTELRLNAYLQAFGGFGFDYTIIAMKIGLFGQLDFKAQLRWLNAMEAKAAKFGYSIDLSGAVGAKLQLKILFISYERILWSQPFQLGQWNDENWGSIKKYWSEIGKGTTGHDAPPKRLLRANPVMVDAESGIAVYEAEGEATLTSRDYLKGAGTRWNTGGALRTLAMRDGMETILAPAYPEANPILSSDGSYLFYLDDLDDPNHATSLRVAASERNGGSGAGYRKGEIISDAGFGDSYVKSAGTGEDSVVVWSRMMSEPPITEAGETITENVQAMMLNSSEVMVATRNNAAWEVTQLTHNDNLADISPAVATNGQRTVAVWRQAASANAGSLTDFSARDYIMYSVQNEKNGAWTAAVPLYIGDLGPVKGLEAEMMADGQVIVTFVADTTEVIGGSGQEVMYAIIASENAADGSFEKNEVSRFVRITSDASLDENPQLASVTYQGEEYFILGWHSRSEAQGAAESDIRLAAINRDGNRLSGFVDNLSTLTQNSYTKISGNFRFTKNADSLEQLSILWNEIAVEERTAETDKDASKEQITGLRFTVNETGKIGVTAAQPLTQMDANTAANLFDGYVANNGDVELVILGTFYDMKRPQAHYVTNGTGVQTVYTAEQTTSIYKASGYFSDAMRLGAVLPDYKHIRLGAEMPVQINVTNIGVTPITEVAVKIGETTTAFHAGGNSSFVSIKPGESRDLIVYHRIPSAQIDNPTYTVTTSFRSGESDSKSGQLILSVPDVGITQQNALIQATDGKRILQFTLFNLSDSPLKTSGNQVCFNLFTDPECTMAVDPQYLTLVQSRMGRAHTPLLTIGDATSLAKIDEGRYCLQYSFDAAKYIQQTEGGKTPFANEQGEIRDSGIMLYAKTWVEMPDGKGGRGEMLEFAGENNVAAIRVDSLLSQAEDIPVTIESTVTEKDGDTEVQVNLQNNSIVTDASGNISVTLLDAQNRIIGWQQSYDEANSLLTLKGEQKYEKPFQFSGVTGAAKATVTYDQKVTLNNDATLSRFSCAGIPIQLSDFTEGAKGSFAASVVAEDIANTVVIASPSSTKAVVTISANTPETTTLVANAEESGGTKTVTMSPGGTTAITATVTAQDRSVKTYTLTITNKNSAPITENTPNATAVYQSANIVLTVAARASDNEAAALAYQWYEYKGPGAPASTEAGNWAKIDGATENTLSVNKSKLAGNYYYYCKVTSTNTKNEQFIANSNFVTATITQSSTVFEGGVKADRENRTYTYGESIKLSVTPKATGEAAAKKPFRLFASSAALDANQIAIFAGENRISEVQSAKNNEELTFSVNTAKSQLAIGKSEITAKYVGDSSMADYAETVEITLNPRSITEATVGDINGVFYYSGKEQEPAVVATDPLESIAAPLISGKDYELTYEDNINAGIATVTVTGIGNYSGTVKKTFAISKQSSTITAPTISKNAITYGDEFTITFTPKLPKGRNAVTQTLRSSEIPGKTAELYLGNVKLATQPNVTENTAVTFTVDTTEKKIPAAVFDGAVHTFSMKWGGDDNLKESEGSVQASLRKKKLTLKLPTVDDKPYDTTPDGIVTLPRDALIGTVNQDEVAVDQFVYDATFASAKIGNNIEVVVTPKSCSFSGADSGYYEAALRAPFTLSGNIILPLQGTATVEGGKSTAILSKELPAYGEPIRSKYPDEDKINKALRSNLANASSVDVFDVSLTGTLPSKEKPVYLILPFPENSDEFDSFSVSQIRYRDGEMETPQFTIVSGIGLRIKLTSAGPMAIGFSKWASDSAVNRDAISVTASKPTPENQTPPTISTVQTRARVDKDGNGSVNLSDSSVETALAKAESQAKRDGTTANGISVTIDILSKETINHVSLILSPETIERLILANVKNFTVQSALCTLRFDLEALKQLNAPSGGSAKRIAISRQDVCKLSAAAQTAIGKRPAFAITASYQKAGKAIPITDFGKGNIRIGIPYVKPTNEQSGNLYGVYADETDKCHYLANSGYNENLRMLLIGTNHLSVYGVGYPATPNFTDTSNHWAKDDIAFVAGRNLLMGTGDNQFSPNRAMTRGMFVTALGRLAEAEVSSCKTGNFTDVRTDAYYAGYVAWAAENGIVNGSSAGTFAPDKAITRQEMAVIMANYAKAIDFALPKARSENIFADNPKISDWATDSVKAVQMAGVIAGKNGNEFDPQGIATRAEVAAVIRRFAELVPYSDTAHDWIQNDFGNWTYAKDGAKLTGKNCATPNLGGILTGI